MTTPAAPGDTVSPQPDPPAALVPAAPPTPLTLLQAMIDKGIDPSALEKMMDLSERWQRGEAEKLFNAAMVTCQAEMPVVVRDAVNSHTNKRYARLEAVNAAIKPVYTKHGFALTFGTEDPKVANTIRVCVDVLHAGGFSRRTVADVPLDGAGARGGANMNAPQAAGSTLTYGQRYVTCLVFNVTIADQDTDALGQLATAAQIGEINDLIEQLRASGRPVDFAAFKDWLNVKDLSELPQRGVDLALDYLRKKLTAKPKGDQK